MATNNKPGGAGRRTPGIGIASCPDRNENTAAAQRGRVLAALKVRKITTLQARQEIDVLHPAARVMELRRAGHDIATEWTFDVNSEGHLHRVARYTLHAEAQ